MIEVIFLTFVLLMLINLPVAFCLGIASVTALFFCSDISILVVVQRMYTASESFSLLAVPFFVMAGGFMETGGISRKLVRFTSTLVGHIRGGLALVSVVAAMFFAGISGSTAADTAAIGSITIPAMIRKKYGKDMATSVQATAGAIGIIIPPSIPMVILGITAGISIGGLFLGGIIPGILMGIALMITSVIIAKKRGLPFEPRSPLKDVWISFKDSILAILTIVIIMGGILSGVFTPTEASIIAATYCFIVGFFVYKEITLKDIPRILVQTGLTTGMVILVVATASSFGWILSAERIPTAIANAIFAISSNKYIILILINALLLFLGTFLDIAPIIIVVVPIIYPIALSLGMTPIHYGIMIIVNMAIGQCTPPVGIALFVSSSISKVSIGDMMGVFIKYLFAMVVVLVLIIAVPDLVTFIPELVLGTK